jgi:bacillopeptidase F
MTRSAVARPVNLVEGTRTYVATTKIKPDFGRAIAAPTRETRKVLAADAMNDAAEMAQKTMGFKFDQLQKAGLLTSYEFLPMTGTVLLNVPEDRAGAAYDALRGVSTLGRIVRNREVTLNDDKVTLADPPTAQVEWNVNQVNAPAVWKSGVNGTGVTVGIVDTGSDVTHEALKAHYRGTKADGTVDNNYNWYDPVNGKASPYDDHGHGTHTSGTTVGGTADRAVGMAPGAKYIATKVFTAGGSGSTATILKGLNWMLAPTDSTGANPDAKKAPDIVSNSWGSNDGKSLNYLDALKAFEAAGILPVFAAGNAGPRAGTVGSPGSYAQALTVGATDNKDNVASFSSRGPGPLKNADGSEVYKPDVSAPGVNVVSAKPGGGYQGMSGTSMATPAVAGVSALILSKHPELTNEQVRSILQKSAKDLGPAGRDYDYGYGRVDASAALALADKVAAGAR